jgi:hypothetical protein
MGSRRSRTRSGVPRLITRESSFRFLARSRLALTGHILTYRSGVSQENRQLQLLITTQKGVSLDIDAAGRDAKTHSKELYLWGQQQDDGIKGKSIPLDFGNGSDTDRIRIGCEDVTDRMAYLNYVQGALSYTLATEIEKCVPTFKIIRIRL